MERVLKKGNIYLGSSPAEWQNFLDFLSKGAPFTHVLDGLNIAFKAGATNAGQKNKSSMTRNVRLYSIRM